MYQFYLILPIVSSSGYDNNSWKQLLDIQLEIIQLEPKAKTLWSGACCAGEFILDLGMCVGVNIAG